MHVATVAIMSQLWIRYTGETRTRYIRGSEIIDVETRSSTGRYHLGKPVEKHTLSITIARALADEGRTVPETIDLWEFPSRQQADNAAATLVRLLALDEPAVIFQNSETSKLARLAFETEASVEEAPTGTR